MIVCVLKTHSQKKWNIFSNDLFANSFVIVKASPQFFISQWNFHGIIYVNKQK